MAGRLVQEVRHANSNSGSSSIPPPPLQMKEEEEKVTMIGRMGSRPPRCDGKCRNCGHCEAIQVPTTNSVSPIMRSSVAYARGDGYSDYKPMSWKCKCGQSLFNP
uniref:Epidermal patterning factor-like protein n=1 Tax=Opuntia streptacantha TaxID=393608 RepID=A0A7C8YPK5_OPUST